MTGLNTASYAPPDAHLDSKAALAVLLQLGFQLGNRAEAMLIANLAEESHLDRKAVDVLAEIKDVRFYRKPRVVAYCRTQADVAHARQRLSYGFHLDLVHAIRRNELEWLV